MRCNTLISLMVYLVSTSSAFQSVSPSATTKKIGKNTVVRSPPPKRMNDLSSTSLKASSSVSSSWTEQRIHNTNWFRCSAIVLSIALAGQSPLSSALSAQAAATIHLLSFGTWFGTMAYTTFVLGITMFKNLPRQTFGKLQAKLFPKYFLLSTITIMLQMFTLKPLALQSTRRVVATLGLSLGMTLLNLIFLEPYSTKIMLERYDLENQEGGQSTDRYKVLKAQFGKMHGMSSLTNLIALCGAVAHGVALAATLV